MGVEEFLSCFDARWSLLLISSDCCSDSVVTPHLPAEVDSKVCQGFAPFGIWQDLIRKNLGQKAFTVHSSPANVNSSFSYHSHLHQGLVYLMKNDKCPCDKVQNLKFVRTLLILPHVVQLYYEDV